MRDLERGTAVLRRLAASLIGASIAGLFPVLSGGGDDPRLDYLWASLAAVAGSVLLLGGGRPDRLRRIAIGMAIAGVFIAPFGLLAAATSFTSDIESWGTAVFFVGVAAVGVILVHLALCILVGTLILLPLSRVVRSRRFRRVSSVAAFLAIAGVSWIVFSTIRDGEAVTTALCVFDPDEGGSATSSRWCPPGERFLGVDEHVSYDVAGMVRRLLVVGYATSAAIALPSYAPPTSPHRPERGGPLSVHGLEPWD